jgi:hypothetical protein
MDIDHKEPTEELICKPLWCQGLVPFSYTRW